MKQPKCDTPVEMRMPASAALLSPEGGRGQPARTGLRHPPLHADRRDALGTRAEAYFQPSFDADADSGEPKRPNLPTHPNNPYNGPTAHDDEGSHDA